MSPPPLSIYLQDHLAGATAGVNLAQRVAKTSEGTHAGRTLAAVASEIEADREALVRLMAQLGVRTSHPKNAAAWLAERLARLKPNGRRPAMQRLHELETLSLGIAGKIALWESLRVATEDASFAGLDLDTLEAGARNQRELVENERLAAARSALAPSFR